MDQDHAFHEFGIPVFDSVAARGKLALLDDAGHALLDETEACPKLTAVSEATVGAIFVALDESLEHEIDNEFELPDRFFFFPETDSAGDRRCRTRSGDAEC